MREELLVVSDVIRTHEVLQRMGLGREVLLHGAGVIVAVQHQVHVSSLHDLHLRIQALLHYFSEVALDLLGVHPLVFVWAC